MNEDHGDPKPQNDPGSKALSSKPEDDAPVTPPHRGWKGVWVVLAVPASGFAALSLLLGGAGGAATAGFVYIGLVVLGLAMGAFRSVNSMPLRIILMSTVVLSTGIGTVVALGGLLFILLMIVCGR